MNDYVPSPEEMEAALERVQKSQSITFEIDYLGFNRVVWLVEGKFFPNRVQPKLGIMFFKPVPIVVTPYLTTIPGWVAVTLDSLNTERCSLMLIGDDKLTEQHLFVHLANSRRVFFQPSDDAARDWMKLQFARAVGVKFRTHSILDPTKIIYPMP